LARRCNRALRSPPFLAVQAWINPCPIGGSPGVLPHLPTGQVGKLVAKYLRRSEAKFSVGTRRKANLEEFADQYGSSRFIDLDDPRTFNEALKTLPVFF
jgi:hypothetical protein